MLFYDNAIISLGYNWYDNPGMTAYRKGVERISEETFNFFQALGYEHIKNTASTS